MNIKGTMDHKEKTIIIDKVIIIREITTTIITTIETKIIIDTIE